VEYIFTDHAIERIRSRESEEGVVSLTMSPEEVMSFLKNGIYVQASIRPIPGQKWDPNIVYLVFYSPVDDGHFVAVCDKCLARKNCTVITIIPANRKGRWMLKHAEYRHAKEIACSHLHFVPMKFGVENNDSSKSINVSCVYLQEDCRTKVKALFKIPASEHSGIDSAVAENNFLERCNSSAASLGISPGNITQILVRLGSNGEPVVLDC